MSASADSCSSPILEPDRSTLLQEALADSQIHAVKAQLERRGFGINTDEAQAVQLASGQQLLIPFGENAHLVWTRTHGQTAALGLVRQGNKTLNISTTGEERVVRFLPAQKVEKLLRKLREKSKFQQFEQKLAQKGKRVGKVRVLLDETNKIAILGIASESNDEKIAHQVRIKLKADKDDEPEDNAEPAIQATACGQATGEAVPTGAAMQPLAAPPGEGDIGGGYEGPQICTSQWGYDYLCTRTTPLLNASTTSLAVPQTFITQQTQASFTVWNGGGGQLTGTVSVPAPFSIVSGGSFSLNPGQPQEVVVRFSSATPGSFSKSLTISSNGGNKTVTATSMAHKVSFSPATVDFGSGLLVVTEQCSERMGQQFCGPATEPVGLPVEKALTVKNEGTTSVTLTLSTSAPYQIVGVLPTLAPGQSGQVTVRFDPNESGTFTGNVQVGINGGQGSVSSSPLAGTAHKIEIDPAELSFGLVFLGSSRTRKLTVRNQGVTTVALTVSVSGPYSLESPNSFTLASSQSQDVTMRFTPMSSGVFSGSIRLSAGTTSVEVPVVGRAMTREEYLQQAVAAYNASVQQGNYGALYVQDGSRGLALAGFPALSADNVNGFLEMFDQLTSPEGGEIPPEIAQALEILNTIGEQQMEGWLWALVLAERAGQFDQEYERLLTLGFDRVVQSLQLISNQTSVQVRVAIHHLVQQLASTNTDNLASALLILERRQDPVLEKYYRVLRRNPFIDRHVARLLAQAFYNNYKTVRDAYPRGSREQEQFIQDINTILDHLLLIEAPGAKITELAFKLGDIVREIAKSVQDPTKGPANEQRALIRSLAEAIENGWQLKDIRKQISVGDGTHVIDLVLYKGNYRLEESGRTVRALLMINFYDIEKTPASEILGGIIDIMQNFDRLLKEYGANFGIVGAVLVGRVSVDWLVTNLELILTNLQGLYGESNAAIFVIWFDEFGRLWFVCIGRGCKEMSSSQRQREACIQAGQDPNCRARERKLGNPSGEPPVNTVYYSP